MTNVSKRIVIRVGLGVLGALVVVSLAWWLRGRAESTSGLREFLALPEAAEQDRQVVVDQVPVVTARPPAAGSPSASPSTGAVKVVEGPGRNLAVTVRFSRNPQFRLEITEVARTDTRTTTEFYAPAPGQPFSILRMVGDRGQTLVDVPFTVSTGGILEGPDIGRQEIELQEGFSYLVLPIANLETVATAQIVAPSTNSVLFEQRLSLQHSTSRITLWQKMKRQWQLSVQASPIFALAQEEQPEEKDKTFDIVVINDSDVDADRAAGVAQETQGIMDVFPWSSVVDRVQIHTVTNRINLGCGGGPGAAGTCANDGVVMEVASGAVEGWDTIIVVSNLDCDCGYVGLSFPPITAVGKNASRKAIIHELGHSVGKMVDEYLGDLGITSDFPGPNCFESEAACQAAVEKIGTGGAGLCTQGCTSIFNWRPANRIMYNTYQPFEFGPVEGCLLRDKILAALGEKPPAKCEDHSSADEGLFWGWRR